MVQYCAGVDDQNRSLVTVNSNLLEKAARRRQNRGKAGERGEVEGKADRCGLPFRDPWR